MIGRESEEVSSNSKAQENSKAKISKQLSGS
jgi:hypothetical protein